MVGVAGKSRACNACRKRRVKCDLKRPSCLTCIKSDRACTGYDRSLIFVNRTPSSQSPTATSVLSELKAQQERKDASTSQGTEADLHYLFLESSRNGRDFRIYAVELLKTTYLPKQPISCNFDAKTNHRCFSWVYLLADLTEPSQALDASLFAFCLAQLHVTTTGNVSLNQCLEWYNTALQHLRSDLDDTERRFREETLAAISVLSTCEIFVCPAAHSWRIHARGIAEILRLRDPGVASTPAWQHLFSRLRIICTVEALTKRRAQFLGSDMWRHIATASGFNGDVDEVFELFAEIPATLERAVTLPSIDDRTILLKVSATVVQSMLAFVKSIEAWLDEFRKASPTPRSWSVPSSASNPADVDPSNKVFPFCFEFESLSVAVPVMMCWSVAAQLYSNVIQIQDLVQARLGCHFELGDLLAQPATNTVNAASTLVSLSQGAPSRTADKEYSIHEIKKEGTRMARYICQSMEYCHRTEMGSFGGQATTYPSWTALQYFRLNPGHEREWSWLRNIHNMEGPGTRWGLSMMRFADLHEPLSGL